MKLNQATCLAACFLMATIVKSHETGCLLIGLLATRIGACVTVLYPVCSLNDHEVHIKQVRDSPADDVL